MPTVYHGRVGASESVCGSTTRWGTGMIASGSTFRPHPGRVTVNCPVCRMLYSQGRIQNLKKEGAQGVRGLAPRIF